MLTTLGKAAVRSALAAVLPRGRGRGSRLAVEGGTPVRNTRIRPWPAPDDRGVRSWLFGVGPRLRDLYLAGTEGLPQPLAREFEKAWAAHCGVRHAILVAHGTDALRIGLAAALDHDGLAYGGEVIVPNYSFIASATAPLDRRFGVAFVDVEPETLLIDPRRIEEAIIPGRTRAILPVHLFGQPADMPAIRAIADRHGLAVVEDAAQAHGARLDGGAVGSFGEVGAFSFQSSKVLNCGEGGAIVTDRDDLFERAHAMQNVGRNPLRPGRWEHETLGWNCRATEYQAALLLHRLADFEALQERRRANFERLRVALSDIPCLTPLAVRPEVRRHGMYMFAMRYRSEMCGGLGIDDFVRIVQAEGIPLDRAFRATLSEQPVIRRLQERHPDHFRCPETPVASAATGEVVYLPHPVFLGRAADLDDVVAAFDKVMRNHV